MQLQEWSNIEDEDQFSGEKERKVPLPEIKNRHS